MAKSRNWNHYIVEWLRANPTEIPEHLSACLNEGMRAFLIGLRHVIEAREGMSGFSEKTDLHRVSLHKMLSGDGNPLFANLVQIMELLDLRFSVASVKKNKGRSKAKAS